MKRSIIISMLVTMGAALYAQYDCNNYHKFNCPRSSDKNFSLNGQSKSAMVTIGESTDLNIIVYRGQDYRISFCSEKSVVGENVEFQILQNERIAVEKEFQETSLVDELDENGELTGEMQEVFTTVVRRVFEDQMTVLYDNTKDEMSQEVEFSISSTKRLTVRVTAQGPEKIKLKRGAGEMDIGCVGVLIEHMNSPEMGF